MSLTSRRRPQSGCDERTSRCGTRRRRRSGSVHRWRYPIRTRPCPLSGRNGCGLFALAASQQRAEALSLASPGTAPAAKYATDGLTTEVRHGGGGHGGGGFRGGGGGGFRGGGGGGFRGGGFQAADLGRRAAFHGGGFRGGGMAIHRGGFRAAPVFRGGGFRAARSTMAAVIATDTVTPTTGPFPSPPASLPSAHLCCAGLLRHIRLLWLRHATAA